MPRSETVSATQPQLKAEFSLVPVAERLAWRNALSLHILKQMRGTDGRPLPRWKIEEQVRHMNMSLDSMILRGFDDPAALEHHFSGQGAHGNDYATSK
ncbi:TPA: hypothetical protein HH296_15950 [Xanthomonas vasicola pv. zeae]|uniref:Uncharacterized protein n=4 Tax=Xanthomonas TaxID=338 RepID=A0A836P5S9_XANVA|nr:hypothetical protein [Xanthomonas vasicola]ARR15280.1 hypothetical protein B7L66_24180 [Xanthomonas citri pv. citri]ATS86819.1 hypothetical protein XcfCFBP6991P_23310 [Xanthomonas citri pv. phaseoli var. fuscans]KGT54037.1 hypothetical protein NY96_19850 [Xanthomonas citri pv. fuscans]MBV6747203.1 hypothetical protein [Xanthomonas vasicola pv. vasculorum NCPPB 890]SOO23778.1 hypothetical protein XFF6991_30098 [Xanthomonas phaseoli pv. phaseoli]HHZ23904.1 hypothetical protein [Xanthomonas v